MILTGGSSRVPMIQAAVTAAVGKCVSPSFRAQKTPSKLRSRIAQNVNADEAAVLGASLYGAGLSRQFKTKDIRLTDITPYDIQVSYIAEFKISGGKQRTINTLLFPAGSKAGTRKTLTFKRKDDSDLLLNYRTPVIS